MAQIDKLERLIEMQTQLNDNIFKKKDIRGKDGKVLTMQVIKEQVEKGNIGPNTDVNQWLRNYLEALNDESRELGEELLWKWWSKDTLDMQNIRVEIIDQLHFWISLALTSGLDANSIFEIYMQKNAINFKRQEEGYSKVTKAAESEEDNKQIRT